MNDDTGWDKIVDAIDSRFGVTHHGRFKRPLEDRNDLEEMIAFIEFPKGGEEYRFERISRPAIIDKKSHYHKAASGGIRYENVYDPDTIAHQTRLYRKGDVDWEPIAAEELAL